MAARSESATPTVFQGFAFWVKRPVDSEAWPAIYRKRELAEACPWRCTDIVVVAAIEREPVNTERRK